MKSSKAFVRPDIKPNIIYITSFEPFGGRSINASTEVVKLLPNFKSFYLPVVWDQIPSRIKEIIDLEPDYLILTGEAGGRNEVMAEVLAINNSKGPDNNGVNRDNEPIISSGNDILKTPIDLSKSNISLSYDAGNYLCNYSYYYALSLANGKKTKCIFVHFPFIDLEGGNFTSEELKDIFKEFIKKVCI